MTQVTPAASTIPELTKAADVRIKWSVKIEMLLFLNGASNVGTNLEYANLEKIPIVISNQAVIKANKSRTLCFFRCRVIYYTFGGN